MTTQEKLIRKKLSLLELSEFLQKISQACRINGYSRQHFYDITAERFSSPGGMSFEVIPIPITPIFFLKKLKDHFLQIRF
jgi:hypothetical protein